MKVKSLTIKNTMLILLVLFSFGMLYAQTSFTYWDFENSNFIPAEGDGVLTTIGDISYEFLTGFTGSGSSNGINSW